eukprot:CAMPEP_0172178858 /NCGR_PEP_ID=MMETSP1050-20130122/16279_1 /TAXON_ID=233186 /ORGANISM="Cryptomonas curvata, Strain CCAP979/52" /LENGTH=107 /DNA_ID=CAMNT_0012851643 /DNA_START=1075 /DNA_END=1395 /DNA_ORIENTATION=-
MTETYQAVLTPSLLRTLIREEMNAVLSENGLNPIEEVPHTAASTKNSSHPPDAGPRQFVLERSYDKGGASVHACSSGPNVSEIDSQDMRDAACNRDPRRGSVPLTAA